MPSSSIYIHTLAALEYQLQLTQSPLAAIVCQAKEHSLSYWDLTDWDSKSLNILLNNLGRAIETLCANSKEIAKYSLTSMAELKVLLYLDERTSKESHYINTGKIILSDKIIWEKTGWVYDLALIILIKSVARRNTLLASQLNQSRLHGLLDMQQLTEQQHQDLIEALDSMSFHYGQWKGSPSYHPSFKRGFQSPIIQLIQFYRRAYPHIISWWEAE